jgi:hypothetical protein
MKLMVALSLITIAILLFLSLAFNRNPSEIEQLTPKQMMSLPKEKLDNLSAVVILEGVLSDYSKATPGADSKKIAVGFMELMLSDLKYYNKIPTGVMNSDLIQAIKSYQTKIGTKPTGILLGKELERLTNDWDTIKSGEIYPIDSSTSNMNSTDPGFTMIDSNHIRMDGTWSTENEGITANPIQDSIIECDKDAQICNEANVYLTSKNSNPYSGNKYLVLQTYHWKITQWNTNQVVAEIEGTCRNTIMNIDIQSKKVISIAYDKGNGCPLLSVLGVSQQKTPSTSQLVGSYNFAKEYNQKIEQKRMEIINSEYIKAIKLIFPSAFNFTL